MITSPIRSGRSSGLRRSSWRTTLTPMSSPRVRQNTSARRVRRPSGRRRRRRPSPSSRTARRLSIGSARKRHTFATVQPPTREPLLDTIAVGRRSDVPEPKASAREDWVAHLEREELRYSDGVARLDHAPDAEAADRQRQLTRLGNAAGGAGLALLMLGRTDEA